jgi:hypothetical protein
MTVLLAPIKRPTPDGIIPSEALVKVPSTVSVPPEQELYKPTVP